jgi:DNA-binding NtrC family response regulator
MDHFLARALPGGAPPAIPPPVLRALTDEPWPGNVRELEHAVQKLVLFAAGKGIDLELARRVLRRRGRPAAAPSGGFPSLKEVEARHVARALEICAGDRQEAARRLGIGRATIYRKIREYGLKVPEPPRKPGRRRRSR